jgi:uncharacterized protein YlxW (UPF0749 family)
MLPPSAVLNLVSLFEAQTSSGWQTPEDRLSRLVDLVPRVSSGQKSAATLAQALRAGGNAADPVRSSAPAAKIKLISDKQPLFDAVPLLKPLFWWLRL